MVFGRYRVRIYRTWRKAKRETVSHGLHYALRVLKAEVLLVEQLDILKYQY